MKPGGTPIGENFHLMTQSYVVFYTEQEYVLNFFLSQNTKILANHNISEGHISPSPTMGVVGKDSSTQQWLALTSL